MEGTESHKEITNDWNHGASCKLASLLVWELKNFKPLDFVVQSYVNMSLFLNSYFKHFVFVIRAFTFEYYGTVKPLTSAEYVLYILQLAGEFCILCIYNSVRWPFLFYNLDLFSDFKIYCVEFNQITS